MFVEKKILNLLIFLFLTGYGCAPYQFAIKKDESAKRINSENIVPDSNRIEVPSEFKKPYVISHGLLFGIVGFFAGGYLAYTWGNGLKIGEECQDCHPELFLIGGGIGFVGGYVLGAHIGSRVAEIKYRKQQQKIRRHKKQENSYSMEKKKVFDKTKL